MYDEHHFTRDAAIVSFNDEASGISHDDNGDVLIDWDDVEQVTIDNAPHADAFDTRQFYRLPATVARPIPQPYKFNDEIVWLKKPRDELKKAAWSLDNRPWTLGHPDTGLVANVDDIRGFWSDTQYFEATDDLDSYLHVPVADDSAQQFIEENNDVSIGFRNRITRPDEYTGIVGGEDSTDVDLDGYQTDILCDHCASVETGRCSGGQGCGISGGHVDDIQHGDMSKVDTGINITEVTEDADETATTDETTSVLSEKDMSSHTHEGSWYAVPPADNPDDEWKFPIDNCNDATDAWNLRGTGDISISVSTLESRIKARADELGCELPSTAEESDSTEPETDYQITMTDDECGCGGSTDSGLNISFDDLSADVALDKLATENDGIEQYLTELREQADAAEAAAEELDVEPEKVPDKAAMLDERVGELQERVDELQAPKMQEDAEFIAERTDRFGEDATEVLDSHESIDELAETRELVEELTETTDTKTANQGTETGGADSGIPTNRRGHVDFGAIGN